MDYTNTTMPPETKHTKTRWVIIFIACLIVLVAIMSLLKNNLIEKQPNEMTEEERIAQLMTAKNSGTLTQEEKNKAEAVMTAKKNGINMNTGDIEKAKGLMSADKF